MSTITTLNSIDSGSTSRGVINTNFSNLNTDKIETSIISTDGTFAANSDSLIPSQKATKTYVDAHSVTIETTTGTTHSLTTVANQKVVVWVMGTTTPSTGVAFDINLKYDGVVKHKTTVPDAESVAGRPLRFALQYTETPGAATKNITVDNGDGSSFSDTVIIVMKVT